MKDWRIVPDAKTERFWMLAMRVALVGSFLLGGVIGAWLF